MCTMQFETGYRLEIATVRKLEAESDAFVFGDKLIEKWYKNVEQGNKKGILLLVTSAKEGALTGGPGFLKVTFELQHHTCRSDLSSVICRLSS